MGSLRPRQKLTGWLLGTMLALCLCGLPRPLSAAQSTVQLDDVKGHWTEFAVTRGVALDLVQGYPSGKFMPDNNVSLLESLVVLLKADGNNLDKAQSAKSKSGQVPNTPKVPWGQPYLDLAVEKKIVPEDILSGFDPDAPATRAQIAAILCRLFQLPLSGASTPVAFFDLEGLPSPYADSIAAVTEAGLMQGYPDGSFGPGRRITRGEMAALLSTLIDKDWAKLPEGRRLEGWLRASATGKNQEWELVSLEGVQKLKLSPNLKCFSGGQERTLPDLLGARVELLLDGSRQAACISLLEAKTAAAPDTKIRGSVKSVILGVDSYLVLSDLHCNEQTLPLNWNATIEDEGSRSKKGFQSLKKGIFIDAFLVNESVIRVVPLTTKNVSGTVKQLTGRRLMFAEQGTSNKPGWFNYWDRARVVDKKGQSFGSVLRGDKVKVTYLDPLPDEIDDEVPLEITVTNRPDLKKVSGMVQNLSLSSGDGGRIVLEKDKKYDLDESVTVKLADGSRGSLGDLEAGERVELSVDGAGVVMAISVKET